jgi:hypothetical protein
MQRVTVQQESSPEAFLPDINPFLQLFLFISGRVIIQVIPAIYPNSRKEIKQHGT